ncbi:MAG TPA: DUF4192 domain-containing protein [Actinocrinis sp.]|uniref:DUF4192 domain-containing protein n=1 Tax=Actinocrinis sp. TaxID=1920516 RepID=UPI002DDCF204|nr:DUF4192 domain-containing protein [Actinocrinis sp.]HEV2343913.1 DUF4192 domain-containing protein [Actinocrinis sp.]
MSVTTVTTTGSTCCGGRGCSGNGCNGCGDGATAEPLADRFDGFQFGAGGGAEVDALAGHLDCGSDGAVRLGSPAEVTAAIPHFFGFHPDSSVVVLGLSRSEGDGRAAISHGLRVDLSTATHSPAAFGRWVAGCMVNTGANETLCVIYPPEGGPARMADYRRVVAGMCTPLRVAGVAPLDVLFVADGRWWSFLCDRQACCPLEGSPVDAGASAIAPLSAYSGLAVLPNRAALAAGLEPYGADMAERMRAACDAALDRIATEHAGRHPELESEPELDPAYIVDCASSGVTCCSTAASLTDEPLITPDGHLKSYDEPDGRRGLSATTPVFSDAETTATAGAPHLLADPHALAGSTGCQCRPIGDHTTTAATTTTSTTTTTTTDNVPASLRRPVAAPQMLDFEWADVARAWQLADSLCDGQVPPDRALDDVAAGELLIGLTDVRVRDYLATWCGDDRAGQAVALSVELARRAVTAEQAAAAFSIAAWAAWALGWGAWSRLCLERAGKAVPGYALATLIKQGLERGVGPDLVREAAKGTARRLNEMRAVHADAVERESVRARKAL